MGKIRAVKDHKGNLHHVYSLKDARLRYEKFKSSMKIHLFVMGIMSLISPIGFFFVLFFLFYKNIERLNRDFFDYPVVYNTYKNMFHPVTGEKLYSIVGYRIYPEDWTLHKQILSDTKKLAQKGKMMKKVPYMQIGFDKNTLTRHFLFIGTTGAGKTELVMSLLNDVIKSGGGAMLLDGKSDQAMEYKFYTLCKTHKYETQFLCVVLNKPEFRGDTNSYNPAIAYPSAFKTSEFLGELLGGGDGGDGNAEYFKNRGKVMLANEIMFYKYREKFYKEKFTFGDLALAMSVAELNNTFYLSYCIAQTVEKRIVDAMQRDHQFSLHIQRAKKEKIPSIQEIEHIEVLYEYLNRYPQYAKDIEKAINVDLEFFRNIYDYISSMKGYATEIKEEWAQYIMVVSKVIYYVLQEKGAKFMYDEPSPINMTDIREVYQALKNQMSRESQTAKQFLRKNPTLKDAFNTAMGFDKEAEMTVENLPQDAVQQHAYAQQQWTRLFGLLKQYSHVTNTPSPDIDGEDLFKNNKFLYVMLPSVEFSEDAISMLGRTFVLMFKNMASLALGGERQDFLPIQFKMYQDRIKPSPLYLAVFDEYGAYPVPKAMPMILAQVRSLNCSVLLSIQDLASTQPLRSDEWELERTVANTSKIILECRDDKLWDKAQKYIPEYEYFKTSYIKDVLKDKYIANAYSSETEKSKPFEENITKEFGLGMGMLVTNREEPVLFQSYYVGGDEGKLVITKLEDFKIAYENL